LFDQDGHPVVPTCAPPVPSRAGALKDGRRPPRSGAARVLERHEHDGTLNAEGRRSAFAIYARILTAANNGNWNFCSLGKAASVLTLFGAGDPLNIPLSEIYEFASAS